MKKFSKVLCLVLVVVMMAGLCAVGTTAAYTDADKITYNEAVDVMSAIGVLQGDDRGFRPADGLTRAEACKIVAYLMGAETFTATPAFADAKGHWAASFIAYCAAQGYVDGVGNNKFAPDAPLTGSAFAKMLLGALGYNAQIEGMTGADWEIAVAKLVKSTELAKGIAKFVGANNITREEAAQLGLNTLKGTCVYYVNGGTTITVGGATINTGASAAAPVANTAFDYANELGTGAGQNQTMQLCEQNFPNLRLDKTNYTDAYGRAANRWTNGLAAKVVGTYGSATPAYTYVATTAAAATSAAANVEAQIKRVTNNTNLTNLGTNIYYLNSASVNAGNIAIEAGDTVEVYITPNTANAVARVVVIREQAAKITNVTDNVGKATVTINGEKVVYNKNVYIDLNMDGTAEVITNDLQLPGYTADYVKGAYLTAVVTGGTTIKATKLAVTDKGAVTAWTDDTNITVNGTKYTYVNTSVVDPGSFNWKEGVYEVVKSTNGYALYVGTVTGGITVDNVVYFTGTAWVDESSAYGANSGKVMAQVVDMNGTVSDIVVGYYTGKNTINAALVTGGYDSDMVSGSNTLSLNATAGLFTVATKPATATYGEYKDLTAVGTANTLKATASDTISSDTVLKTTDKKFGSFYTTAETQYILVTGTGATTKAQVYTGGIGYSVDASADSDFVLYTSTNGNNVAKVVVIKGTGTALTGSEVLYMAGATNVVNGTGTYAGTLYGMDGTSNTYTLNNTYGAGFWKYTKNTQDVYALIDVSATALSGTASYVPANFVNGAFYENVGFKASYYENSLTIFDKADPAGKVLADIDASNAVVVDVRTPAAKAANYDKPITNLTELAAAAATFYTGTTNNNVVTISLYVTNNGAQVIFVNSLEEDAYTIAAQSGATNATFFLNRAANGTLSGPVTLGTTEIKGGTTVYVKGSASAEKLTAAGVSLNTIVIAVDGTAGVYSFVMPYGNVAATVFTEADV